MLREWKCGAFLCLCALGPGVFSGRETAFFYTQTGRMSWLGILLCAGLYGLFVCVTAHFAKKTGSAGFAGIFRRKMGIYAGSAVWTLHGLALLVWLWIMLRYLGRYGELMLPVGHGKWLGMAAGLACAWIIVCGKRTETMGIILGILGSAFLLALLLGGKLPRQARMYGHVDLKLEGSAKAAAILALLHSCRCMAVSAGVTTGFAKDTDPVGLGLAAALWMALFTGLGNGALMKQPDVLMALKEPFAAMQGQWGKAGYFLAAGMMWSGAEAGLAGVVFSLRGLMAADGKNGC